MKATITILKRRSSMDKPKLYISGAISGMPDLNRVKFAKATQTFRRMGYLVVNPHEVCEGLQAEDWKACMKRCISAMMDCQVLILLDDWQQSPGANIEFQLAWNIGIEPIRIEMFLENIQ